MSDVKSTPEHSGTSRRTVVRTAAHAAWAVPAIQIATSAPAFAAMSDRFTVTVQYATWNLAGNYIDVSLTVQNDSPNDITTALQIQLTFPGLYAGNRNTITVNSSNWSPSEPTYSSSGNNADRTANVVFTSPVQLAAGGSTTMTFRITTTRDVTSISGADRIDGIVSAPGTAGHQSLPFSIDPN